MNTEEKAKAYDEALERAKDFYKGYKQRDNQLYANDLETIFPELRESEDEQIRKEIEQLIQCMHDADPRKERWIAWLEKQGNLKSDEWKEGDVVRHGGVLALVTNGRRAIKSNLEQITIQYPDEWVKAETKERKYFFDELEKQGEQKPADKVEPKFHEGEWITNGDYIWKIVEVKPLDYILQSQNGNIVDDTISHVDEQFHSFTIQDAKDGDVLATSAGAFIYNGNNGGGSCPGCYCGINTLGNFKVGVEHHWTGKSVFPATKEQRDTLERAITNAGYRWDREKLKLEKI